MLTKEENDLLTQTGPDTPMGAVLRRYWVPVALSSELPDPDCPPIRIKLLREKLVAFRATHGRVGLLDEFCAHRRASLFLGRNEECGLRCVYHGWKYDVDGNCVDMPNKLPESNFKEKIRLKAYPTTELGGLIWAYMGPKEEQPPLPQFEWTQIKETHRYVSKTWQECNWLQAVEGGFDRAHLAFLHRKLNNETSRAGSSQEYWALYTKSLTEKLEVELTDSGFFCASIMALGEKRNRVMVECYVMPFHKIRTVTTGGGGGGTLVQSMLEGHIWVPMDDESCMDYAWWCGLGDEAMTHKDLAVIHNVERQRGRGPQDRKLTHRKVRNKDNDWLIDRDVQKRETFSGIDGVNIQDHAVQESMGSIVDRTKEHLGGSDKAVVALRHLLLNAAKAVREGKSPLGVEPRYDRLRPFGGRLATEVSWRDVVIGKSA